MAISDRIQSIEQHLEDDYSVLELAGADLTNVDKNIVNLKPTWKERLLYFINNGTEEVYDNWDKVTGEGTSLTLNNTLEAKMKIVLKGNTSQDTTTGKNLLRYTLAGLKTSNTTGTWNNNVYTLNGLTFTLNDDLTIKVNGTATGDSYTRFALYVNNLVLDTGSYYMSGCPSGGSASTYMIKLNVTGDNDTGSGKLITRTSTLTTGVFIHIETGTQLSNLTFKPMINTGTTAESYEMPIGITPNPDYPQPIHVVSGDNSIKVEGKNLFDPSNIQNGYTSDITGIIAGNGKSTDFIEVEPNTKYYILATKTSGNWGAFYNESKTFISGFSLGQNADGFVTTPNNTKYIAFTLESAGNNPNYATNTMIAKSNQATTYEPYTGASYPINLPVENLIGIADTSSATYKDVTYTISNGEITLNGTASGSGRIEIPLISNITLTNGTNYTLSGNFSGTIANHNIEIQLRNSSDNIVHPTQQQLATPITYNNISGTAVMLGIYLVGGVTFTNYKIKPQLEKGTKANHYTPYGTTPIELCKIGTYQDKIDKSTGKNLFNPSDYEEGYCYLNQVKTANANWGIFYLPCIANQKYTISGLKSQYSGTDIMQLDSNKNIVSRLLYRNSTTEATITATQNGYIGISFVWNSGATYGSELGTIMLNLGTTALPYEPYGTSWYLKKEIGKVVLNGTEDWRLYSQSGSSVRRFGIQVIIFKDNTTGFSNYFLVENNKGTNATQNVLFLQDDGHYLGIADQINTWNDTNALKTFLSSNNTIVYYVLATPTYTLIEGELLNQLEALDNARSMNVQTNISQDNNDLASVLNASALQEM